MERVAVVAVTAKLFHGSRRHDARIRTYTGKTVQVSGKTTAMSVMSDGEIERLSPPLRYEIRALAVPARGAAA
ncbi:diacylglycerol kinase family protein [Catellatospora vulcania]|uniref:hypothetical protein n=1 Tax=Catellatospora vulcania TaxID=1460450 RepID=UPI0012D415A5|nr:hypothetical protein [Catellatospora vulcania]